MSSSCPAGAEVEVLEWLDAYTVIVALRAPDGWYEFVEIDRDQLDFEVVE